MSHLANEVTGMIALKFLDLNLSICRIEPERGIPNWAGKSGFLSITRTGSELSVVCESRCVPHNFDGMRDAGWICIEVEGPLDLGLTGILASITGTLADAAVPLFAVCSYDTDYILVKSKDRDTAYEALSDHFTAS